MPEATVLINPDSGFAEQFSPEQTQQAIQSGYHIPLVDQSGQAYAAPFEEAQQLVQAGTHAQPTDQQLQSLLETAHYNTPEQQALTFIEGALEPNTFGTYGKVATSMGLTTPEAMLKRQEHNPGTHALGEAAGLIGGIALAPESSIPGIIGHAGETAASAIAGTGTFGKAAQLATRGAIEGGLYAASHELSENLLGDPSSTADHILGNIGLGAALGGGFNLALSPIFGGIQKAVNYGKGFAGRVTGSPGLGQAEKEELLTGLMRKKSNAQEIQNAADLIGAPVLDSQLSDSEFVQKLDSSVMQSPSWTGIKAQQKVREGFYAVENALNDALGNDLGMTKNQVGTEIQKGLTEKAQAEYQPIQSAFNALKEIGVDVPINQDALTNAADDLLKIPSLTKSTGEALSENSSGYKLAKRVSNEMRGMGNVDDLQRYANQLSTDIPFIQQSQQEKFVTGEIKQRINNVIEQSIKDAASTINPESEFGQQLNSYINQSDVAKNLYGEFKQKISTLGKTIGKNFNGGQGIEAFTHWLNELPPEKLVQKLFTKDNANFLGFLRDKFPNEADLISKFQKSEIRDAAFVDGRINAGKVLREIGKLEPEAQNFLFKPNDLEKINAAKTWVDALPPKVGPSGTPEGQAYFNFLTLRGAATEASSFLKKSLVKSLVQANPEDAPKAMALLEMARMAGKTARNIERYSGAIFSKPAQTLIEENKRNLKKPEQAQELHPLKQAVMANSNNPQKLIDHLSNATQGLDNYIPNTINALTTSVGRATQFLASKVPNEEKVAFFDRPKELSIMDISKFNRYAQIVDNPISILKHIKSGTLLPQDLETLSTVYPQLYSKMQQSVMDKLITYTSKDNMLPYQTRLGLSMFLGQNLDSTLSPQGIQSSQMALGINAMQQQMQSAMQHARPSKVGMGKMKTSLDETRAQQALDRKAQG